MDVEKPVAEEENLWSRILDEVQQRSSSKLPQASVLLLGDNESGKTALIAHLKNNEDVRRGSGLEYHYLDVNPDYKDGTYAYQLGSTLPDMGPGESARLGVWTLDGDTLHAGLIRYALASASSLDKSVVLLCVSMSAPWTVAESLERWARLLETHLERPEYTRDQLRESREAQVRFWQEYLEPLDSSSHSDTGAKVPSMEILDSASILLPLGENVLTRNIGLPIVVVVTKTDYMANLEKECDMKEEHFDFIQYHIRKFCLKFGAALVYTSVKDAHNCDLLYKYVLHRVYGFPFTNPALVVEKDSIFIPAGWDNEKKIGILLENFVNIKPEDNFSDVIQKPVLRRPVTRDQEITAEEHQAFLSRLQTLLNSAAPPQNTATPHRPPADVSAQSHRTPVATPKMPAGKQSTITPGPMKAEPIKTPAGATPGGPPEGVLANFFNQLLHKKTGATPASKSLIDKETGGIASTGGNHLVSNAAAEEELQRILQQTGKAGGGGGRPPMPGGEVNSPRLNNNKGDHSTSGAEDGSSPHPLQNSLGDGSSDENTNVNSDGSHNAAPTDPNHNPGDDSIENSHLDNTASDGDEICNPSPLKTAETPVRSGPPPLEQASS